MEMEEVIKKIKHMIPFGEYDDGELVISKKDVMKLIRVLAEEDQIGL